MEKGILEKAKVFYFMIAAVMMYYFLHEVINLGIFLTFRHAFALVLAISAITFFLYKPNIARGITAFNSAVIYSIPLLVTVVVSLFIWFTEKADADIIARGLSGAFVYTNMLSFALAATAFLYVFGEKGIWYNLIAILISNLLMVTTVILENGLGAFFSEFITLITTFASVTGDIIVQAEIHELAFCLGAYLIYMLLKPKKDSVFLILLIMTLFCFLCAFKRIGVIAIVIALLLGWLLKLVSKISKETASRLITFFTVILIALLIGYVALIKLDGFEILEKIGIDTSGRVNIYNAVDKFYEFSPGFMGNGIGFLTYQLNSNMAVGVAAVHNDFLQYFIDLGFWGYILWLVAMTITRIKYFGSGGRCETLIITFSLIVYLIIVSSTDNTMNYPLLTTVLAILMAGDGFDERVRQREIKMFGCVSEENEKRKTESVL